MNNKLFQNFYVFGCLTFLYSFIFVDKCKKTSIKPIRNIRKTALSDLKLYNGHEGKEIIRNFNDSSKFVPQNIITENYLV